MPSSFKICSAWNCKVKFLFLFAEAGGAFCGLTLLAGHREKHLACKNWVIKCWRGYLSGARCKWFAYGPADATATPSSVASLKSRIVLPFWCWLTQVVLEKRLLNRCLPTEGDGIKQTRGARKTRWNGVKQQMKIFDLSQYDAHVQNTWLIDWVKV